MDCDLDMPPDTLRVALPSIPPEAVRDIDDVTGDDFFDDEPTLVIVPSAIAALAERSAIDAPPAHARVRRAGDEETMRVAAIALCMLLGLLLALAGVLDR